MPSRPFLRTLVALLTYAAAILPAASSPDVVAWRNPITGGTAEIDIQWIRDIDSFRKRPSVAFAFYHARANIEVVLAVERHQASSIAQYVEMIRAASEIDWGKNLWELTRNEAGRDIYYAAYNSAAPGSDIPALHIEYRVWRDSTGAFWSTAILCPVDELTYLEQSRTLVRALEETVDPNKSTPPAPIFHRKPA